MISRSKATTIVQDKIQARADEQKSDAESYIIYVFEGGDPTEIGGYSSKWEGAKPYAQEIANAYRETQGKRPIPVHPAGATGWNLCDLLLSKLGQWIPNSELREITRGQQVPTFIRSFALRDAGLVLEKNTIDGKVHYRLVEEGVQ